MDRTDEYSGDRRHTVVTDAAHRDILDPDPDVLVNETPSATVITDVSDRDDDPELRTGDVLGLAGSPVPKMPGDPSAEHDPEAVAQRRARMRSGEAEGVSDSAPTRTKGATGIDMGAGGTGTGLSGD